MATAMTPHAAIHLSALLLALRKVTPGKDYDPERNTVEYAAVELAAELSGTTREAVLAAISEDDARAADGPASEYLTAWLLNGGVLA